MNRFVRAPFAALLAGLEELIPATPPRRTMADAVDALNDYEELHETLPEPSSARFGSTWCATHHTTISTCYQEHTHTHTRPDETVELDYVEQAKERGWPQCLMHDHTEPVCAPCCYADNGYCDCECHPQSSPNPHGDLPSVPMPADGSAAEVSAAPPAPSAAPSTFTDWATPAICNVLIDHTPHEGENTIYCSCGWGKGSSEYDWFDYREHVAPSIAQRLEAVIAQHPPK